MAKVLYHIPVRTVSEANRRDHWAKKAARAKRQRGIAAFVIKTDFRVDLPAVVTLTRIGPRKLDSDNLAGAFKAVRDGIADAFGVDDGDDRYTWRYEQRKGAPKEYAVTITIEQEVASG